MNQPLARISASSAPRVRATLLAAALFVWLQSFARAGIVTEDITFNGPQQVFNLSIGLNGSATLDGSGTLVGAPFLLTPSPQTLSLTLSPNPTVFAAQPNGIAAQVQIDDHTGKVIGITSLNLNLLGNSEPTAVLQPASLNTSIGGYPAALPVNASFQFLQALVQSTGPAIISGHYFTIPALEYMPFAMSVSVGGVTALQRSGASLGGYFDLTGTISYLPASSPHDENIAIDCTISAVETEALNSQPILVNNPPAYNVRGRVQRPAFRAGGGQLSPSSGPGECDRARAGQRHAGADRADCPVFVSRSQERTLMAQQHHRSGTLPLARVCAALVFGSILSLAATARAGIVTEDITFNGPQQSFNLSIGVTALANLEGSGTLVGAPLVVPDQDIPLTLNPNPTTISSTPSAVAAQVQIDDHTGQVVGISRVNVDLLNGAQPTISLQQAGINATIGGIVTTLPVSATFQLAGAFNVPYFYSTGPATISGSTFSMPGYALIPIYGTASIAGFQVIQNDYIGSLDGPLTITGTISYLPASSPHSENIALDVSYGVANTINDPLYGSTLPLTVNDGTLVSFNGAYSYSIGLTESATIHLQADPVNVIVPEPASATLALIGLIAGGFFLARRKRK